MLNFLHYKSKKTSAKSEYENDKKCHNFTTFYVPARMFWCRNNQFTELVKLTP